MMKCQQRITWICIPVSKGEVVVVEVVVVVAEEVVVVVVVVVVVEVVVVVVVVVVVYIVVFITIIISSRYEYINESSFQVGNTQVSYIVSLLLATHDA